ncbi:glycosyltransferase [Desulfopila inferna]|uniref:glycosyltransferase n=1 Tax=Desulfopila inferna TaxID=468528 RepID=UPI00196693AE|nr:glycosyltransferase [Desulfopila inferna]MBM9605725.1 glycosyltransferase [Desulfopila inferna]
MKILQIIGSLHIGGAERVVYKLAKSLTERGHEIEILCVREKGIIAEKLVEEGIPVSCADYGSGDSVFSHMKNLRSLILDSRCDLAHSHGTAAMVSLAPFYAFGRMPPLVHTFHFGNYPHLPRKYMFIERLMSFYAKKLVAVSDHQRRAIIHYHKVRESKIETIWNGVENPEPANRLLKDKYREEFSLSKENVVIGCVAVLSRQKGLTYLLAAAKNILDQYPQTCFLIVGGGPLEEDLQKEADSLGIGESVIFTGWRDDAWQILTLFDIFILPSLWEGLPVVLVEAMAAGKPVVVTNVGDNAKLMGQNERGLLIEPRDVRAIETGLKEFLDNPGRGRQLAEEARRFYLSHLTEEKMINKYDQLFGTLVRRV